MNPFTPKRIIIAVTMTVLIMVSLLAGSLVMGAQTDQAQAAQDATATVAPTSDNQPQPAATSAVTRSVSVTGTGYVDVTPDIAVVSLGVRTEGDTAREALTQNNTQMEALLEAVREADVERADIKTRTIQIQPRYRIPQPNDPPENTPTITGYIAMNTVDITVRDLDALGELLDNAVTAGSNQVDNIYFNVSDPRETMDQARETAMTEARRKAEQLAGLAGARLGPVITISENTFTPIPYNAMAADMVARGGESVPVSPGSQRVEVSVQVTWELVPGQP